ncbi:Insecticidal toxin complex protein [Corallibacter sp.]|uniref:Insecticidal toxin complex protein n=1 Tax=Corallibacter sp. TaxID=2038084 RepID=UPI003AB7401E
MRSLVCFVLFASCFSVSAKEWNSLRSYQKETGLTTLQPSDWLKHDRKKNTLTWQKANLFNLQNNRPHEYATIKQRRDFYEWLYKDLEEKGFEVMWPKMAYYISNKLRLTKAFPFSVFTTKDVKLYAYKGSVTVFDEAFTYLNQLYYGNVLRDKEALHWDKNMLYQEQYYWLQDIYNDVGDKTLKTISRMAKGKGFYRLVVPKAIRFHGDISNQDERYKYALSTLRIYCKSYFK